MVGAGERVGRRCAQRSSQARNGLGVRRSRRIRSRRARAISCASWGLVVVAARWLARSAWTGYRIERNDDGRLWMHGVRGDGSAFGWPGLGPTDAMLELRFAADDARRLSQEVTALVERYAALDRSDEGPPNLLSWVASVPVAEG